MLRLARSALFVCAALAVCAAEARAESIGPDCGTCQGSIYTLENLGVVGDIFADGNLFDTYRFKLTIDTTGYNGGGVRIDEVAIKVASSADKAKLVDAPGGAALWTLVPGGLNASGCSGSGSGFECADWVVGSATAAVVPGKVWSWTFDVDVSSPLLSFNGPDAPSIKVRYVDNNNNKIGALVSETIRVPEPCTLALLGIGAPLAAIRRRRAQR
jgi:hypothetical protein